MYIDWIQIINKYFWAFTYDNTFLYLIDWLIDGLRLSINIFSSQCQTAALDELFGNPQEVIFNNFIILM